VEEALRRATGRQWTVRVEGDPTATVPAPVSPNGTTPTRPRRQPKDDAEKLPLVKRAVEILGATITRVDDGFGEPPGETRPHGAEES
jgi:hypothetical protein